MLSKEPSLLVVTVCKQVQLLYMCDTSLELADVKNFRLIGLGIVGAGR
jgi:hypothetical protein